MSSLPATEKRAYTSKTKDATQNINQNSWELNIKKMEKRHQLLLLAIKRQKKKNIKKIILTKLPIQLSIRDCSYCGSYMTRSHSDQGPSQDA